jgi:hypothetical protein
MLSEYLSSKALSFILALQTTQHLHCNILKLIKSLKNIYLLNNHVKHPSSSHNHLHKLLIVAIIFHIEEYTHHIALH